MELSALTSSIGEGTKSVSKNVILALGIGSIVLALVIVGVVLRIRLRARRGDDLAPISSRGGSYRASLNTPPPPVTDEPRVAKPLLGQAKPAKRPTSLAVRLLGVVLLGVVVYGALVVFRGARKIEHELETFAWWAFAASCALSFANYLLRFVKWEYYLALLGLRTDERGRRLMPLGESFLVFLSGFVLTVTPGKVGEVFKSLVLFEIRGVEVERTAPIVVAERVTDLVGVIILITIGGSTFPGGLFWAAIGSAVVISLLAIIAIPPLGALVLSPWGKLPGAPGRVARRVVPRVAKGLRELRGLTRARHLLIPSLLSVVGWALEGIGVFLVLRGFHIDLDPFRATFFYSTATLAGALVPVPGGLGVTEKVLEESMVAIGGVPGAVSTATMILSRLATLWFAVLVGFVALALLRLRYPTLLVHPPAPSPREEPTTGSPS